MTTYATADLLAAIDTARDTRDPDLLQWGGRLWQESRNAHLDTLRAILDLHRQRHDEGGTRVAPFDFCLECDHPWPCPTVQVVADALRKMGALDE